MDVSVVDFEAADAPERFTESLLQTGFAVLVNHPLDWPSVEAMFSEWNDFFDHPGRFNYPSGDGAQGGYFPPTMSETAQGNTIRDLKEFSTSIRGRPIPPKSPMVRFDTPRQPRRWPAPCSIGSRPTLPDVAARFSQPLSSMMDNSTRSLLRILRYPP
ncbi:MAG: 2-oxoglutarate and iron-dependent oxygenase domain-containing protein [Acidimicrobiales bacterium]